MYVVILGLLGLDYVGIVISVWMNWGKVICKLANIGSQSGTSAQSALIICTLCSYFTI